MEDIRKELLERMRFNAHDYGELGKFVRLNYIENFINEAFGKET